MSALAADKNVQKKAPGDVDWPVVASDIIYLGALTMRDTSGNLKPAADTASCVFAGISQEHADNSTGAAGAKRCKVNAEDLFLATGTGFSAGDEGKAVFASDDQTVTLTAGNVRVGIIRTVVSSTQVWVDPRTAVQLASRITDGTTDALYASLASSTLVSAPSLTRSDALFASLASSTLAGLASSITSASFSATVTSAEAAAVAGLVGSVAAALVSACVEGEKVGDDVASLNASAASNVSVVSAGLVEAEKVGDDVATVKASLASDISVISAALVEAEKVADLARLVVSRLKDQGLLAA